MFEFMFFVAGAALSWGISHYYYQRSNKEIPDWFSVDHIKGIISKNPADYDWTARELAKLFNERVYDKNATGDPLPYRFCPGCGSDDLRRSSANHRDDNYYFIRCNECKWEEWTQ